MNDALFSSRLVGKMALSHRVVLAPLTRVRATTDTLAPHELTAEYYSQRASAGGLLVTEAVSISLEGAPVWSIYPSVRKYGSHAPGIWSSEQVAGWHKVTTAVHEKGGLICCQLLHAGRVAQKGTNHPLAQPNMSLTPVAPSAVGFDSDNEVASDYNWCEPSKTPRALASNEIARVVADYEQAAIRALRAGFDCVEIHAAHGYLINQFLCDGVNKRKDRYGGSIENRCRLLFEVVAAVVGVVGAGRVSVRLSPTTSANGSHSYFGVNDSAAEKVYAQAVEGLNSFPLAYLLLTEPRSGGLQAAVEDETFAQPLQNAHYRDIYQGTLIAAGGFTPHTATAAVASGFYDLIAFGRWFISNPDLVSRLRLGSALNVYERETFYGGGAQGYTDYPDENGEIKTTKVYESIPQADIGVSLKQTKSF